MNYESEKADLLNKISKTKLYSAEIRREFLADREVGMALVKQDGRQLARLSQSLRADKGVVATAVTNYGLAIKFASPGLRSCRWTVMRAMRNCPEALDHAFSTLQSDDELKSLKTELQRKR